MNTKIKLVGSNIIKRPGLDEFLKKVSHLYEVVIFSEEEMDVKIMNFNFKLIVYIISLTKTRPIKIINNINDIIRVFSI